MQVCLPILNIAAVKTSTGRVTEGTEEHIQVSHPRKGQLNHLPNAESPYVRAEQHQSDKKPPAPPLFSLGNPSPRNQRQPGE